MLLLVVSVVDVVIASAAVALGIVPSKVAMVVDVPALVTFVITLVKERERE